jgi:hypothetical protein
MVSSTDKLLPGEGRVGHYADLLNTGSRGDNLTPHHIPKFPATPKEWELP